MTILKQILDEIKTDDNTQKIRELCDKIQEEETPTNKEEYDIKPKGPNIFLSLEVPGRTIKEVAYLTLERDSPSTSYVVVLYTVSKSQLQTMDDISLKRRKVWAIDDHRPEKILTFYAKHFKYMKGE